METKTKYREVYREKFEDLVCEEVLNYLDSLKLGEDDCYALLNIAKSGNQYGLTVALAEIEFYGGE